MHSPNTLKLYSISRYLLVERAVCCLDIEEELEVELPEPLNKVEM